MRHPLKIIAVLTFLTLTVSPSHNWAQTCIEPPEGLIAWWPFDEDSGTSAEDIIGEQSGVYVNGPSQTPGVIDGALQFDGQDDYVRVNDSDEWAFGTNDFTLELWANFASPTDGSIGTAGDVFVSHNEGAGNQNKWFFALGDGILNLTVFNEASPPPNFFVARGSFEPIVGQWYHLAVTKTGTLFRTYVDGIQVGSEVSPSPIANPNAPLVFGQSNETFGGFMDGILDEITIYNRALSSEELISIVNARNEGKCKPLRISSELISPILSGELTSQVLEAQNGEAPFTWSVIEGRPPKGMSLSSDGLLEGIPTEHGEFFFIVEVVDGTGESDQKEFILFVRQRGVFDLALDWSDALNPNGVWSYNSRSGTPIITHWDDWDPTNGCCFSTPQPAWGAAQWPQNGHVPVWLKVVGETTEPRDFPKGKVIMHGAEGSGPAARANVTWTSPLNGVITIGGGVWLVDVTNTRSMDWVIYKNETPLTSGSLTPNNPRSSIAPFKFQDGSSGREVLSQAVNVGDIITLEFNKTSTFASFVGVDFTIFSSLEIISNIPAALKLGEGFSQQLEIVGGIPSLNWTIVEGTLPPGMTLSTDGVLSGTPTELGDSAFNIQVQDGSGEVVKKAFTVEVVLILPPANISITKQGTIVVPGRLTNYFIAVENIGQFIASDIVIREALEPLENFSDPSHFKPAPNSVIGNLVEWKIDQLNPGEMKVFNYGVTISPTVNIGDLVKGGPVFEVCDRCRDADECKFLNTICEFTGVNIPTGIGLADIFETILKDNLPSNECTGTALLCIDRCENLCESDSDNKDATGPFDPNEKLVLAKRFIQPDQLLTYPIHFENIGEVEAIDVFVNDVLDPKLDDSTLELLTPDGGSYNPTTRTVRWELLGRNLQPGETDNVLLSVKPLPKLPSGTEIRNRAEIQFEIFEPLVTPDVVNIIDTTPPNCTMDTLPLETTALEFPISWTGSDTVGEIDFFSVFVSKNGEAYQPFVEGTVNTTAVFSGDVGDQFAFFCVAKDTAGNLEKPDTTAEAETRILLSVKVPSVTEISQADAKAAIIESGLMVGNLSLVHDDNIPVGNVISQDPSAGEEQPEGSKVDLVVSLGPSNQQTICSYLGNDPKPSLLDQDKWRFKGRKGEIVTFWLEKSGTNHIGNRATLRVQGKKVKGERKTDKSDLPNKVTARFPHNRYLKVTVAEQPLYGKGKRFRGYYCLTMEANGAEKTLEPVGRWVEP